MYMKQILNGTVYASLIIQFATALIDVYALQINILPEFSILKKLLGIELFVQLI